MATQTPSKKITISVNAKDFDDLTVAELDDLERLLGRPLLAETDDGGFDRGKLYSSDIFGFVTIIMRRRDPEWTLPKDTKLSSIEWVGAPGGSTTARPSRRERRART